MSHLKTIYIAAPLFSQAELSFNSELKNLLKPAFNVYLPQEDGELLDDIVKSHGDIKGAYRRIFSCDISAIRNCDILLIVLDGRTVDEGAAFELGVAYALKKECLGIQTDPRRLVPVGNNPMIAMPLKHIFSSTRELETWVSQSMHSEEKETSSLIFS